MCVWSSSCLQQKWYWIYINYYEYGYYVYNKYERQFTYKIF